MVHCQHRRADPCHPPVWSPNRRPPPPAWWFARRSDFGQSHRQFIRASSRGRLTEQPPVHGPRQNKGRHDHSAWSSLALTCTSPQWYPAMMLCWASALLGRWDPARVLSHWRWSSAFLYWPLAGAWSHGTTPDYWFGSLQTRRAIVLNMFLIARGVLT